MAEFSIKPMQVKSVFHELQNQEKEIGRILEKLIRIKENLDVKNYFQIIQVLDGQIMQIDAEKKGLYNMRVSLQEIVRVYENTEASLTVKSDIKELPPYWRGLEKYFLDNFNGNLKLDLLAKMLESGGNFGIKIAGLFNQLTALARGVGENSFIIVNPVVSETTLAMTKGGSWMVGAAKYGLPLLGGVIDFIGMYSQGENTKDALIKSAAHIGIGVGCAAAGEATGAAVGAAIGSIIPGVGTVVGAVVGYGIGFAFTLAGNYTFDYVYDNWDTVKEKAADLWNDVSDTAEEVWEGTQKTISDVCDKVGDAISDIGDCVGQGISDVMSGLGTVFG